MAVTQSLKVGDTISQEVTFDAEYISSMATLAGDTNPLHHDPVYAGASRFGGIIASGAHTTMLMLGLLARFVTAYGMHVGREFSVRLDAPIRVAETATARWTVKSVETAPLTANKKILLHGVLSRADGVVAVDIDGLVISLERESGDLPQS